MTSRSLSGLSSLANLDGERVLRLVSAATAGDAGQVNHPSGPDPLVIGKCIRYRRKRCGLTLGDLGERVGLSASAVSLIETGKREAKVSTLAAMADALDCQLADLLTETAPSRRATLELELERAQRSRSFAELRIPAVKAGPRLPLDALESLVALHDRLAAYSVERDGTPEYARRANADLRARMRASDNYFPAIEDLADELVLGVDHDGGPLTRHRVNAIADRLGFSLHSVPNLPQSTRSVTDLAARRIFLPTSDSAAQRTLALAALGHVVLQHRPPADYAEFLAQRVEVNYFAAAVLIPQRWAVTYLREAKDNKDLEIEDLRDRYLTSYEMAAHRFTNLATIHLDIPVHFMKTNKAGIIYKAYANDGVTSRRTALKPRASGLPVLTARRAAGRGTRLDQQYTGRLAAFWPCGSRAGRARSVLGVGRDAVRARQVVPGPWHPAPLEVPLSRSDVLHAAATAARRSLDGGQLAQCAGALGPASELAGRGVPRGGPNRGDGVP
jgi:transcriptional regulator with XRE-family HTH domain